ncbi:MAG TPA: RNA-binding cell elongation regulator Jag/EloR [Anaerolineales bacterium]|nr:RNA-binding cell elongation regulator Jag/EloR [Anaerolineales bacterium]HNH26207.1 RNA-binding cell elongation regulator Jag/EloR [Anaerolineales bacterium]HNO95331.1 RNA-binding cell elongation regulator Jag/EloR [Anaerolineales bacterium]
MSERTTLEIIAPTVEEAIQQGLDQLGLTADAVSVEVLDSGSKGLFGLGGRQVRVRISVNPPPMPEIPAARPEPKPAPAKKAESKPKAKEPKEPKPRAEKKQAEPKTEAKPEPKPEPKPQKPAPQRSTINVENDAVLNTAEEVVSKLIYHMGMTAQVSAHYDESDSADNRTIQVDVRGEDLSALIGRRAETLASFQHVASLIVGKQTQQWVQVIIDVEGYRARREKQIRQLANRMADQVTKTGRKVTMEPMPSSERRVVHIELRGHPAVKTESTGEEPYRKVVILPKE